MNKAIPLLMLLLLCACSADNEADEQSVWQVTDGISIKLSQAAYAPDVASLDIIFTNNSGEDAMYGYSYAVEKRSGDEWMRLETNENYYFEAAGIILPRHSTSTLTVYTDILKEPLLDPGQYRVVGSTVTVSQSPSMKNGEVYPNYIIEFTVSNATSG